MRTTLRQTSLSFSLLLFKILFQMVEGRFLTSCAPVFVMLISLRLRFFNCSQKLRYCYFLFFHKQACLGMVARGAVRMPHFWQNPAHIVINEVFLSGLWSKTSFCLV